MMHTMLEEDKRKCLCCDAPLEGRSDKRFCSTPCRNEWNNERRRQREYHLNRINGILRSNWKILSHLNEGERVKVPRVRLEMEGFNFRYITAIYTSKGGTRYFLCYDQGYTELEEDRYLIVKWKVTP